MIGVPHIDYDKYGRGGDAPPRKERDPADVPEWKIQAACATYYKKRCRVDKHLRETTRLFASMNEADRTQKRAAIMKMMGAIAGAPWDLTLIKKSPPHGWSEPQNRIFWIEVKRPGCKLSAAQKDWAMWLGGTGIETRVVHFVAEFEQILEGL